MNTMTFNEAQRDVLGVMSCLNKEDDIRELKKVLLRFLNERLQSQLDDLMDKGVLTQEKMNSWETAHFRTAYK